jgi:hypothetical protein
VVWPMGNDPKDFEKYIKKHASVDPYADVEMDPIYYADCAEWLIAEGRAMAELWRYYSLPDEDIKDYPFSWEVVA